MDAILKSVIRYFSSFEEYRDKRMLQLGLLGFTAGLPLALIFSSLSLWLREAGLSRTVVTFFSWAALGYSFKFVWSPLVDKLRIPFLTNFLGQRRSWLLVSQFAIMFSIIGMALSDPSSGNINIKLLAIFAVLLGFSSATQDIVIDAYRIECAPVKMQTALSAVYIAGYRIGMIASGAGALYLVSYFSKDTAYDYLAWQKSYFVMASLLSVGMLTTLSLKEPLATKNRKFERVSDQLSLLFLFIAMLLVFIFAYRYIGGFIKSDALQIFEKLPDGAIRTFTQKLIQFSIAVSSAYLMAKIITSLGLVKREVLNVAYVEPVTDFFSRYQRDMAILLLLIVGFYRVSDIVLGVIANVFYQDMGFSLIQIASASKTYGVIATLAGGFIGGSLAIRYGVLRVLLAGAILAAATNLLYILLSLNPGNEPLLYLVITVDNLSVGIASTAFIAFLSSLTNISFTAIQYAIFSSMMSLLPKLLGGYSGTFVDNFGYTNFFIGTALLGVPIILLVTMLMRDKRFKIEEEESGSEKPTN